MSKDNYVVATTNQNNTFVITPPEFVVDSHSHIQSNRCCPIPIIWGAMGLELERDTLDGITYVLNPGAYDPDDSDTANMAQLGAEDTFTIATKAADANDTVKNDEKTFGSIKHSPLIVLTMDMAFAHFDGYKGEKIYTIADGSQEGLEKGEYYFPKRTWSSSPEGSSGITMRKEVQIDRGDGERITTVATFYEHIELSRHAEGEKPDEPDQPGGEIERKYHDWDMQLKETEMAAVRYPFKIIPMFHVEPRRYIGKNDGNENIEECFNRVATESSAGIFLGFKLYCSLGYQPRDPKIPFLNDLSFYKKCRDRNIPILCHHSPDGLITHDRSFYFYNLEPEKASQTVDRIGDHPWLDYFQENFVHPKAWDKVLKEVPDLKLCLAHFGGNIWKYHNYESSLSSSEPKEWQTNWVSTLVDMVNKYENLYVDISYFTFSAMISSDFGNEFVAEIVQNKDKQLLKRILFGTDWFVLIADKTYKEFASDAKKFIDEATKKINPGKGKWDEGYIDLWELFTFTNPMRFYGLNNLAKLENMKTALEEKSNYFINVKKEKRMNEDVQKEAKNNMKEYYAAMQRAANHYNKKEKSDS